MQKAQEDIDILIAISNVSQCHLHLCPLYTPALTVRQETRHLCWSALTECNLDTTHCLLPTSFSLWQHTNFAVGGCHYHEFKVSNIYRRELSRTSGAPTPRTETRSDTWSRLSTPRNQAPPRRVSEDRVGKHNEANLGGNIFIMEVLVLLLYQIMYQKSLFWRIIICTYFNWSNKKHPVILFYGCNILYANPRWSCLTNCLHNTLATVPGECVWNWGLLSVPDHTFATLDS